MDVSVLTGLLPLTTRYEGIRVWGSRSFADATHLALDLIVRTPHFALVRQQIRAIGQRLGAGDRVKWGTGVILIGHRTWRLSSIEYGAELIRTAARHERYDAGIEVGDPDTEFDCTFMSATALRRIGGERRRFATSMAANGRG